jgi:hypothetical protein
MKDCGARLKKVRYVSWRMIEMINRDLVQENEVK